MQQQQQQQQHSMSSSASGMPPLDRLRSREEMKLEMDALWAAGRGGADATSAAATTELFVVPPHQQQHNGGGSGGANFAAVLGLRRSNDKRKSGSIDQQHRGSTEAAAAAAKGASAFRASASLESERAAWQHEGSAAGKVPAELAASYAGETDDQGGCCQRVLPFRAIALMLRRHPSIWITTLLVFLLLAVGGVLGVYFVAAAETTQRRLAAEGFAINAAVAFERQLQQMFFPLLSLAVVIRNNPDYKVLNASFDQVARELMDQMPTQGVTNLIAAPQGVLRNVYPLAGYCQDNCANINIDLFRDPERRAVALKTVKEGRLVVQGPMNLAQGYFGVVGRQPIYIANAKPNETFNAPDGLAYNCSVCFNKTTNTQFWGFVNAVINLQSLVSGNDSRMQDLRSMGYEYRMFKLEKNGTHTEIARTKHLAQDPVQADVHVPGSTWFLQVAPDRGWTPVWRDPIIATVVVVSALFALLLGAILVSAKLQAWLKATNEELAHGKERMDVLLARQHNLLTCLLQEGGDDGGNDKARSAQQRTLARIENLRHEIGVAQHTSGTTAGTDELTLVELLDEGSFGKVFRGLWRGTIVAVKTMVLSSKMSGTEKRERMAVMEAAISSSLQHPNIVQTFTYVIKPCSTSVPPCRKSSDEGMTSLMTASGGLRSTAGAGHTAASALDATDGDRVHNFEVSLVLEFCDWGSLRTALDAGAFFAEDNSLNYAAILDTAADIARAMLHLHKHNVLHGDLKVRNILLKSDASGRGCIAKVADFGLAVRIDCMDTHVSAFQGTLSHLAPEALLHGRMSKAADVFAFAVSLWELFTGGQAYQGIPRALVGHKVAVLGLRPTLPPFTPPDFRSLVEDCWHQNPDKRPSFEIILARLARMRADLQTPATPPLQRYKLQPKDLTEPRNSSEKAPDGALLNAQHAGLLHIGSCVGGGATGTGTFSAGGSALGGGGMWGGAGGSGAGASGLGLDGAPPLQPARRSMDQGGGGSGGASEYAAAARAMDAQLQVARRSMELQGGFVFDFESAGSAYDASSNGAAGGGGGNGGAQLGPPPVSSRPAPRTAYLRSGLYAMSGVPLVPIPDTEDQEEAETPPPRAADAAAADNATATAADDGCAAAEQQQQQPPPLRTAVVASAAAAETAVRVPSKATTSNDPAAAAAGQAAAAGGDIEQGNGGSRP